MEKNIIKNEGFIDFKTNLLRLEFSRRITAMLVGGVIGDGLGVPLEMMTQDEIKEKYNDVASFLPTKYNKHFVEQGFDLEGHGYISDDSLLTLAILKSINKKKDIDYNDIVQEQLNAYKSFPYGFGKATRNAFERWEQGLHYHENVNMSCGNGIMMKQAPLAAYFISKGSSQKEIREVITNITNMTHNHPMALVAALVHNKLLMYLLRNSKCIFSEILEDLLYYALDLEFEIYTREEIEDENNDMISDLLGELYSDLDSDTNMIELSDKEIIEKFGRDKDNIKSSGYVYTTMGMVYATFFRDPDLVGLINMLNMGGDTDTYTSIIGNMIGAYKGRFYNELFESQIQDIDIIRADIEKFVRLLSNISMNY